LSHLSSQPRLVDLALGCPSLADGLANHLAELKQLKRLSLAGSSVTDAGIERLASLPNLEWLDLRRTKATEKAINGLKEALPKVTFYPGPRDADGQSLEDSSVPATGPVARPSQANSRS
jgi:hypothetical protein